MYEAGSVEVIMGTKGSSKSGSSGGRGGIHTVPKPGGGWVNKEVGSGKVISEHRKKEPAVDRGASEARRRETEHTIHKVNGQIGEKNSYGNDPNPPKDKR